MEIMIFEEYSLIEDILMVVWFLRKYKLNGKVYKGNVKLD